MDTRPSTTIRAATADDVILMTSWAAAMALETEGKELDYATVRQGIAHGVADSKKARYFVAELDGVPAGMLMLTMEWSDWRNGNWWWIQSVYVAPANRRRGVYAALHEHVVSLAKGTEGVVGIRLYVEKENTAAQRTYSSLGMVDARYLVFETAFAPSTSPRG